MPSRATACTSPKGEGSRHRSGIDIVRISRVQDSLDHFGDRFARRLFTPGERAWAGQRSEFAAQRYALRFAAKEAAVKAFDLSHQGVNWRDIEVVGEGRAGTRLFLHGKAGEIAAAQGCRDVSLSLSHDGDYAIALVVARFDDETPSVPIDSSTP